MAVLVGRAFSCLIIACGGIVIGVERFLIVVFRIIVRGVDFVIVVIVVIVPIVVIVMILGIGSPWGGVGRALLVATAT